MKTYLIDTNIVLRFLLKDVSTQYKLADQYFHKSYLGKIRLFLTIQVIFEANYILSKKYFFSKEDIIPKFLSLIYLRNLQTENKNIIIKALDNYLINNLSLVDNYLSCLSKHDGYALLTFDKKLLSFHQKTDI